MVPVRFSGGITFLGEETPVHALVRMLLVLVFIPPEQVLTRPVYELTPRV